MFRVTYSKVQCAVVTFSEEQVRQLVCHVTQEQQMVPGFEVTSRRRELSM